MTVAGLTQEALTFVETIDDRLHQLELTTILPLGITLRAHIVCVSLERKPCRVQIGSDFHFPPGLRGKCIERLTAKRCLRHIEAALAQIKALAESAGRGG